MKKYCIILASGSGSRFGMDRPKQFACVNGKMIIEHTLQACDCGVFDELILVASNEYVEQLKAELGRGKYSVPVKIVSGGATRLASCKKGVEAIDAHDAFVVVHNGAQPFVKVETFRRCVEALGHSKATISAIPCTYTIMRINDCRQIVEIPQRNNLVCDMGVEGFHLDIMRRAFDNPAAGTSSTNVVGLVLELGLADVSVFEGDRDNIKITYPEDLMVAEERLNG